SYRINHAHNKRLKRDCQRAAFPVPLSRGGFLLLCLGLVVVRCQPLRRALCKFSRSCLWQNITKSRVLLSRYGI
ncbi:hypothetical protein FLL96_18745, partial [Vibrio cholerae]